PPEPQGVPPRNDRRGIRPYVQDEHLFVLPVIARRAAAHEGRQRHHCDELNPSDAGTSADDVAHFGENSPMGRPAQPEELAPAYVFLASNADSSYITGTVLQVMGGETTGG